MKRVITVIELLLIFIIFVCAGFLGFYFYQSHASETEIEELKKQLPEEVDYSSYRGGVVEAYYDLYEQNRDFAGWIKIDGTPIDYPVMQAADNEFYLHRDFQKEYRYSGLPFADYRCDLTAPCTNIILYAHNMKDGSMFAGLTDYEEKSFYEAHKIITFNTLADNGEYEIIAAFRTTPESFDYHNFINAPDKDDFDAFISRVKRLSEYDTARTAEYGDYLLTLSTCAYNRDNERFVVIAKKIN